MFAYDRQISDFFENDLLADFRNIMSIIIKQCNNITV